EGWHGIRFDRPVTRMRETIDIVRQATRGERASYKGRVYELPLPGGEGKALRSAAAPQPGIPIYLATLSPKSLELTGEIADGWLGTSFMPEHARVFFDHLEAGATRAGRSLAQLDLQVGGFVAFSDDVDRLIPPRKPGLAFTLGAMGSRQHNFYNDAFKRAGYEDVALEVQRLWLDGRRDRSQHHRDRLLGNHLLRRPGHAPPDGAGARLVAHGADGRLLGGTGRLGPGRASRRAMARSPRAACPHDAGLVPGRGAAPRVGPRAHTDGAVPVL